jgi:acyl carrier protein|tara:strand:- start:230 stop:472 length:243 start_codon:yes stop_codon:yes gene_type:complete
MKKKIIEKELKIIIKIFFKKNIVGIENLLDYLDSIQMLDLISSIEKKFKVKIKDKYITEKNFKNYNKIKELIIKITNEKK